MTNYQHTAARESFRATASPHLFTYPETSNGSSRSYLLMLGLVIASSVIVLNEPAPFDIAIMLLFAWSLFRDKLSFRHAHTTPALLLAAFTLANLISFWEPIDMLRGLWFLAVTVYLMLSMLFISGVTSRFGLRGVQTIAMGYALGGVMSVLLGAFGFYVHGPWQSTLLLNGRARALFKDPNVFGPYLVPMVIYAASQLVTHRRKRLLYAAVLLTGAYGVLISFSRACWLNCMLATAAYFCLRLISLKSPKQRKALLKLAAVPTILLVAATAVAFTLPSIQEMMAIRVGANGLHNYDQERFGAHEDAINTAIHHPLGIGAGQWERWYWMSVHSLYYRVLSENGFDGLAVLLIFLLASLYRSLHLTLKSPSDSWRNLYCVLSASLLGVLLNSTVVDTLHWRHVWLLLGLIWTSQPTPVTTTGSSLTPTRGLRSQWPAFDRWQPHFRRKEESNI